MKKLQITFITALICLTSFGQELKLNSKNSNLNWTGKAAFNAYSLTGNLTAKTGKIIVKNDSITTLEVIIDMKSLHHKNKDLKKHLKNKDFFQVKKYSTAIFILNKAVKIKDNKAILEGNMTIKNKTHKEIIEATIRKDNSLQLTFTTKLNRTKYGIIYNSPNFFKRLKQNAIADDFILESSLFFN